MVAKPPVSTIVPRAAAIGETTGKPKAWSAEPRNRQPRDPLVPPPLPVPPSWLFVPPPDGFLWQFSHLGVRFHSETQTRRFLPCFQPAKGDW